jgi:hypothetical protein
MILDCFWNGAGTALPGFGAREELRARPRVTLPRRSHVLRSMRWPPQAH